MNKLTLGILAHVDAGKTSLAETLLYNCGSLRTIGRVDKGNAFLDTFDIEKQRGITVYSKEAYFKTDKREIYLLDTPGHKDFSSDMERTLRVLDCAILVVSGSEGVQSHTKTLWRLLEKHGIPVMIFINKMDMATADGEAVFREIRERLSDSCVDFNDIDNRDENIGMCDDEALEHYMENNEIDEEMIKKLFNERKLFPCYFGSALRNQGVDELIEGLDSYAGKEKYPEEFGARIFKVSRDSQNKRLTHLKITGGSLKVKDLLSCYDDRDELKWEDKADEVRVYSGNRYRMLDEAEAGTVCVVTGLEKSMAGDNLGFEKAGIRNQLEPVFTYRVRTTEDVNPADFINRMYEIGEEQPDLDVSWNSETREILVRIMGKVQLEILKSTVRDRYGVDIDFEDGNIIYKETISDTVEGVGHFEPLRHYAEVHLLLEPLERGSGMVFASDLSEDILERNWQRLVISHLKEKEHRGVLTGSAITDIRITLVNGRANRKHTSGGDFRQATYRAVRQGLMQAESVLLEPYYSFTLQIPEENIGRAMYDLESMNAGFDTPVTEGGITTITGTAPVVLIQDYYQDVLSYTRGEGELNLAFHGYDLCHDSEAVIMNIGYNPESDLINQSASVFCQSGSGVIVPWTEVFEYMHLPLLAAEAPETEVVHKGRKQVDLSISRDEIDSILNRTYYANSGKKERTQSRPRRRESYPAYTSLNAIRERFLLVDGYNVIFSWDDLKDLASHDINAARERLISRLNNYQAYRNIKVIVVFDAYRVVNHRTETYRDGNIEVIYTKQAQTADSYIEKFTHEQKENYQITVVTSDNLEQIIARANDALIISSRKFLEEVERIEGDIREYTG